jgi:hypothetical protein
MRAYTWEAQLHELESADLVAFRSWLLNEYTRDQAKRTLSCFHSMLIEMVTQGVLATDPAARITIQRAIRSRSRSRQSPRGRNGPKIRSRDDRPRLV